ncbi:MAG: LytR C-terminal domain-containing protein [Candidatus Latescibacteria bacterium]|nr:LytR C-terminal domain-containing protein [Candidatus Latescibacterota bacterium]
MKRRIILIIIVLVLILGISYAVIKHYNFFDINKPKPIDYSYRSNIRLEIINCSGINKQGQRAQDYLRSIGFDVYGIRSGARLIGQTTVIERINPDMKNAIEVSNALGFNKKIWVLPLKQQITPEVQKDLDSLLYLEVTLILGKDCEKFFPEETQ